MSARLGRGDHLIHIVGQVAEPKRCRILRPVSARGDRWNFHGVARNQRSSDGRACLNFVWFHFGLLAPSAHRWQGPTVVGQPLSDRVDSPARWKRSDSLRGLGAQRRGGGWSTRIAGTARLNQGWRQRRVPRGGVIGAPTPSSSEGTSIGAYLSLDLPVASASSATEIPVHRREKGQGLARRVAPGALGQVLRREDNCTIRGDVRRHQRVKCVSSASQFHPFASDHPAAAAADAGVVMNRRLPYCILPGHSATVQGFLSPRAGDTFLPTVLVRGPVTWSACEQASQIPARSHRSAERGWGPAGRW